MKDMVKSQCSRYPSSPAYKIPMGKESRVISKIKPQIRIIHIYAPEIIKTDAANFRELVQRLTGKSAEKEKASSRKSKSPRTQDPVVLHPQSMVDMQEPNKFLKLQKDERAKHEVYKEVDVWRTRSSNNKTSIHGFFDGLSDFDNFVGDLTEFPVFH